MQRRGNTLEFTKGILRKRMSCLFALLLSTLVFHQTRVQATDTTTTMSWTLGSSTDWATCAVLIDAADGNVIHLDSTQGSSGYSKTFGWFHTVGSQSNGLLIVSVAIYGSQTVSSVTYNSSAEGWSKYCEQSRVVDDTTKCRVEIWYKVAPPSGGMDLVVVSLSSQTYAACGSVYLYGVDQTTPLTGSSCAEGTSIEPSVTIIYGEGAKELVLDTFSAVYVAGTPSVGPDQGVIWSMSAGQTGIWYLWGGASWEAKPTAAKDISLAATGLADRVLLEWETGTELDTAGFSMLRAVGTDGPWVKLNHDLIPSKGSSWQGASYTFSDDTREPGTVYWYRVQEVSSDGGTTRYAPHLVWDEGLTDADGDGMPDLWEKPLGIDSGKADDADADADGDGAKNLEEYLAGTSPTDAAECPTLVTERNGKNGSLVLRWIGRPGRTYRLVSADSLVELLNGSAGTIFVRQAGSKGPMQFEDTVDGRERIRFYRLSISPPK